MNRQKQVLRQIPTLRMLGASVMARLQGLLSVELAQSCQVFLKESCGSGTTLESSSGRCWIRVFRRYGCHSVEGIPASLKPDRYRSLFHSHFVEGVVWAISQFIQGEKDSSCIRKVRS